MAIREKKLPAGLVDAETDGELRDGAAVAGCTLKTSYDDEMKTRLG